MAERNFKEELERLKAEFEKQNAMLDAAREEFSSLRGQFPVSRADLEALEELCAVEPPRSPQSPTFGTRC
jgi:hypothetical protein